MKSSHRLRSQPTRGENTRTYLGRAKLRLIKSVVTGARVSKFCPYLFIFFCFFCGGDIYSRRSSLNKGCFRAWRVHRESDIRRCPNTFDLKPHLRVIDKPLTNRQRINYHINKRCYSDFLLILNIYKYPLTPFKKKKNIWANYATVL